MDTLTSYSSADDDDDGDNEETRQPIQRPDRRYLQAAPAVSLTAGRSIVAATTSGPAAPKRPPAGDLVLHNNPKKMVLYEPVQGPQVMDPTANRKTKSSGAITTVAFDETTFHEERNNYQRSGRAVAPDGETVFRTTLGYSDERIRKFAEVEEERCKRPRPLNSKTEVLVEGSDDEVEYGVWGPPTAEERHEMAETVTDLQKGELHPLQQAERDYILERNRRLGIEGGDDDKSNQEKLVERKMAHLLPDGSTKKNNGPIEPTTTFHGDAEYDYKGRSWMAPPAGMGSIQADGGSRSHHHTCYIPKQCVARFPMHHEKGIQRIRLFPKTAHLVLSAGLDGTCKVWNLEQTKLMRTYHGHSAAVRDVQFNHDGKKFVSASFDKFLRLWDTESGEVLQTFSKRGVPYCVQFYPRDDTYFCVGGSDSKIVTYNSKTGKVTQEYSHHLAPVNAILFVDDHGIKLVSSGDDKKILIWEWDIGVPIKYISDPSMHSIPSLCLHPSNRFICGQSLDNTICVVSCQKKFAMTKSKYSGHVVSGYACEMSISPDGNYLASGDGNGNLFIWDWKKHGILQKYKAHSKGPAICTVWHPLQPSTVLTCGWDGIIKVWK